MNELIWLAGKWSIDRYGFSSKLLNIRAAGANDRQTLVYLSKRAFGREAPNAQAHAYAADNWSRNLSGGVLLKFIAETVDVPVGYVMLEIRPQNEIYIFEMASVGVPNPIPKLGSLLLAVIVRIAQQLDKMHITANLSLETSPRRIGHQTLMLLHARRHGVKAVSERGFLFDGGRQSAHDIWLTATRQSIVDKLDRKQW